MDFKIIEKSNWKYQYIWSGSNAFKFERYNNKFKKKNAECANNCTRLKIHYNYIYRQGGICISAEVGGH